MELIIGDKIRINTGNSVLEAFLVGIREFRSVYPNLRQMKRYKRYDCVIINDSWSNYIKRWNPNIFITHGTKFPDDVYHTTKTGIIMIDDILLEESEGSIKLIEHNCEEYQTFFRKHKSWFNKEKMKCDICDGKYPISKFITTDTNKHICKNCLSIKPYSTKNNLIHGYATKKGVKYGFELECVSIGNKEKNIAKVLEIDKNLIPTSDASLPRNGVEFKTPILNNLRGMESKLEEISKYWDFKNEKCGQHINISIPEFTVLKQKFIALHSTPLDKLCSYMYMHKEETIAVCGRFFTQYCYCGNIYDNHCNWINLSHNGRAEFRLSKLITPNQYINLAHMWTEILYCCIDYYNDFEKYYKNQEAVNYELFAEKFDDKYSKKMIKIFNKHYKKISKTT